MGWLQNLLWWHWWVAAAVLGAIEVLMPGASAIWFAAAAAVTGLLVLAVPLPWQWQLVVFGALAVAAVFVWRRYTRVHPETTDQPKLNQRAEQYVGKVCELSEPIRNGSGKARVGDGFWNVRGPELPAGAKVRVIATEGALLVVEAA